MKLAQMGEYFGGDKGNRRYGVPIFKEVLSKQQGGVTLSSSEAEHYATSEVDMELKFLKMVLEFL